MTKDSRISEAFKAYPIHNNNQKVLDLHSVKELPISHEWISFDKYPCVDIGASVPIIDLNDKNAIKLVGYACKTWGVFQVVNHNISNELLAAIETAGKSLFSLPLQQKLKAARPPNGISGYGVARISSFFPKHMWSEGFTIVGSPLEHACQLWPQDYIKFCDVIEKYEKGMKILAEKLTWLMLGSLGITKEDHEIWAPKKDIQDGCSALQMNNYPVCPDPDRAMGLAAHTDSTILTILHQNNTSGLQVLQEGIGWVTIHPSPGALTVQVGDLLHILSNGLYLSALHRAVVNRSKHRLSIAYLHGPPSSVKVSPLSNLIDHEHPPLYMPITWSEYLGTKAQHFDKALSTIRLCAPLNDHNRVQVG